MNIIIRFLLLALGGALIFAAGMYSATPQYSAGVFLALFVFGLFFGLAGITRVRHA